MKFEACILILGKNSFIPKIFDMPEVFVAATKLLIQTLYLEK